MYKKNLLILMILFVSFSFNIFSQTQEEKVLIGKVTLEQLTKELGWKFDDNKKYAPNDSIVNILKGYFKDQGFGFLVVIGTWCKDSKEQLPYIVQLVKSLNMTDKLTIYALDKDKKDPDFLYRRMGIERVPTLFLTYLGEEMTRIVEKPKEGSSWEADLLSVFQ